MQYTCKLRFGGEYRWVKFICRTIWSAGEHPQYLGVIGKAVDIHEERKQIEALEKMASCDDLTGFLNRTYAKKSIQERIALHPNAKFAFIILDVDAFKTVNDTHGHLFGDHVLVYTAEQLRACIGRKILRPGLAGMNF